MAREPRSRWWRCYTTLPRDKRDYTDAQFRAFITAISIGEELPPYGVLPKLSALRAELGSENVDFLVAQGDIDVSGELPVIAGRDVYQAPPDRTAAERQARHRQRSKEAAVGVDNDVDSVTSRPVTPLRNGSPLPSISISNVEPTEKKNGVSDGDFDALDRYYELTMNRPWGRRAGEWLAELIEAHGDVNVAAALEVEHKADSSMQTLLGRVTARLAKQADRVEKAAAKERKLHVDPVREQYRRAIEERYGPDDTQEPPTGTVEEGRAAWAALKAQMNGGSTTVLKSVAGGRGDSAPADVGTPGSAGPTRDRSVGSPSGRTRGPSAAEQAAHKS